MEVSIAIVDRLLHLEVIIIIIIILLSLCILKVTNIIIMCHHQHHFGLAKLQIMLNIKVYQVVKGTEAQID